jgi:CspA family cold shock protein
MTEGVVKYFNDYKGWGFIRGEEPGKEVYVHYTAINMDGFRTLKEGQKVLFELAHSAKGLRAESVTPID